MTGSGRTRTDTASRVIRASPGTIYRAFIDPDALVSWLPPAGMTGRIHAFEPRPGGIYRMALTYGGPGHAAPGKTAQHTDIVRGRFLALIPDRQVAQLVEFESEDHALAGEMTMTWSPAPNRTSVREGKDV